VGGQGKGGVREWWEKLTLGPEPHQTKSPGKGQKLRWKVHGCHMSSGTWDKDMNDGLLVWRFLTLATGGCHGVESNPIPFLLEKKGLHLFISFNSKKMIQERGSPLQ